MKPPLLVLACKVLLMTKASLLALTFPLEIHELKQGASQVVEAEVIGVDSLWSSISAMIVTEVTFKVQRRYKGYDREDEFTIRLPGGRLGGQVVHFNTIPNFEEGERVFLFFDRNEQSEFDTIHGGVSGKYVLDDENMVRDQALRAYLHELNDDPFTRNKLLSKQVNHQELEGESYAQHRHCGCSKMPRYKGQQAKVKYYSAPLPLTINPIHSASSLVGRGLAMIAEWNQYGEIFEPLNEPQPAQWNNGVCDIVGFADEEVIKEKFGITWGRTLGFTVSRTNELGEILEADIYLNPNVNWAEDNEEIPFKNGVYGIDLTIMHELGHVLGLEDNFEELSVMNYAPRSFDGEYNLKASDVKMLMGMYPQTAVLDDDVGLYMYRSTGYQSYSDAICKINGEAKSSLTSGDTITVEDFTLESCGGKMTLAMNIQWKLTPGYQSCEGAYDLGVTQAKVSPGESMMLSARIRVPDDVPEGIYYLAGFIDSLEEQVAVNNAAWLKQKFSFSKSGVYQSEESHLQPPSVAAGGGGGCLMR